MKRFICNGAICIALSIGFAGPAQADCCGATIGVLTQILEAIQNGFSAVRNTLELSFKASTYANGQLTDGLFAAQSALTAADAKARAIPEYELPPDHHVTGGAAEAARRAVTVGQQISSMRNSQLLDRMLNSTLSRNGGNSYADVYAAWRQKYSGSGDYPNGDVSTDTLLNGAGKPGKVTDYTFNQAQVEAATRYLLNATNVTPLPSLTEKQSGTEEARRYIAMQRIEQARAGVFYKSFADALAWREPVPGLAEKTGAMWRAMSKVVAPNGQLPDGNISTLGFLAGEVQRRYANPNWYVAIARASPAAVMREQTFMQALDMQLRLVQMQQMEQIGLVLAQSGMNQLQSSTTRNQALQLYNQIISR